MKIGTLFSGIGAPELALKSLGKKHSIEFACDNDPYVKKTYLSNHSVKTFYDDVNDITKIDLIDLLVFGFPCQPFSLAGDRNGLSDERGKLVLKAIDIIRENKPRAFLAENVEGLLSQNNGKTFDTIISMMSDLGYNIEHKVLNSLDFGIPQSRKRLWIVGTKKKGYKFPSPKSSYSPLSSFLEKDADKFVFATKDFLKKPKVKKKLATFNNNFINCITQTISRNGSSSEYINYVAAVNYAIGECRKPTVQECCKLFGVPSSFNFPEDVCITRQYSMLANSMVVPLCKEIIKNIFKLQR